MSNKHIKKLFIPFIFVLITLILIINNNKIDNYYNYINQKEIETKEQEWSYLQEQTEQINNEIKEIINNTEETNIIKIYNEYQNISKQNSINILKTYINKIKNTQNINEFIKTAINIEKELNINIFTSKTIMKDFKEDKNTLYLTTIPMDYGFTSEYYTNENLKTIRNYFKLYNNKLLKEYGYTSGEALDITNQIDNFYETISKEIDQTKLQNTENYYNIVDKKYLQKIYTNIDINYYFKELGLSNIETFSLVDEASYKKINELLTEDNLKLWQNIVTIKILQTYSEYTNQNYNQIITKLNEIITNTKQEDYIYELIKTLYPNQISKQYNEKNLTTNKINEINNLTNQIIEEYNNMINNSWMESQTKEKALTKLNNIKINIGSNYTKDYSSYYNYNDKITLLENIININKTITTKQLEELNTNNNTQSLPDYMVNAYYNITDNSINILTGITNLLENNKYENLGKLGTIIAHEISHAFDNNGSKFDENGKLNNWYTETDQEKYNQIQTNIIEYYNNYEIINEIPNDGTKTIGENIADLAALECITNILQKENTTKDNAKITFKSYAKLWSNNYSTTTIVSQSLIDTHSPNQIRVNAVLSSNDYFYKIYNIKQNDEMYIEPQKRVNIWTN